MTLVRIIDRDYLRVSPNPLEFTNPRRGHLITIVNHETVRLVPSVVTISGTVKDIDELPLINRTVRVFLGQSMTTLVGSTKSLADGTFSTDVTGHSTSTFTVTAQGDIGENCQVFSKVPAV